MSGETDIVNIKSSEKTPHLVVPSGHSMFYIEMLRRQTCLNEPRCAAWEVCAPISPEAGCCRDSKRERVIAEFLF